MNNNKKNQENKNGVDLGSGSKPTVITTRKTSQSSTSPSSPRQLNKTTDYFNQFTGGSSSQLVSSPTSPTSRPPLSRKSSAASTEPNSPNETNRPSLLRWNSGKVKAKTEAQRKLKEKLTWSQGELAKMANHVVGTTSDLNRAYGILAAWIKFRCEAIKNDRYLSEEIENNLDEGPSKRGGKESELNQHLAELRSRIVGFEINKFASRNNYVYGLKGEAIEDYAKLPILSKKKKKQYWCGY